MSDIQADVKISEKTVIRTIVIQSPRLDPVMVCYSDTAPGQGRIVVECYGSAWSAWWGSMGTDIEAFVASVNADYLTGALAPTCRTMTRKESAYLKRIAEVVIRGMKLLIEGD